MRETTFTAPPGTAPRAMDRRKFMACFSAVGLAGTAFPAALWEFGQQGGKVTKEMLADAEAVAGLRFTDAERELMLEDVNETLEAYAKLRTVTIPNSVHPALVFDPVLPGRTPEVTEPASRRARGA